MDGAASVASANHHPTNGHTPPTLIRDLPSADRPRERLRDYGAEALSTPELLAILLRTGAAKKSALQIAHDLVARYQIDGLRTVTFGDLCSQHGLGEAKAAQILAAIQLGVRIVDFSQRPERRIIKSPEDAAHILLNRMCMLDQEEVWVLQLDTRNHIIGETPLYRGSVHTTHVRMAEIFREAVRMNASAIVVAHNHPSGDPTPSAPDVAMTKSLADAGKLLDIDVLDHMVFGGGKYVSMRNLRLGFDSAVAR
jgi:DNA repair protein RadC